MTTRVTCLSPLFSCSSSRIRKKRADDLKKLRFQRKVIDDVDKVVSAICRKAARRKGGAPLAEIQKTAFDAILSHPRCKVAIQERCEAFAAKLNLDTIRDSFAEVWECLSKPSVVATIEGFGLRRALAAAMAGPRVSFRVAKRFLRGALARKSFQAASQRRAKFMDENVPRAL